MKNISQTDFDWEELVRKAKTYKKDRNKEMAYRAKTYMLREESTESTTGSVRAAIF